MNLNAVGAFLLRHFRYSLLVTAAGLFFALLRGSLEGMFVAAVLGILEVSLSFDNAVVNASVLKEMDEKWRQRFLTWGILIAVFGMRLLFPILIVAATAGLGIFEVTGMAFRNPDEYARHLHGAHTQIAAFGGMFLLLVFFSFLMDETKDVHWLGDAEAWLARVGKLESAEIVAALLVLLGAQAFVPAEKKVAMLAAGIAGVVLYVLVTSVSGLLEEEEEEAHMAEKLAKRSGVLGFLYLEVLDASFSFDGVIGAFAITKDIVIITLGLMIGAMFVRSLTVYLVKQGTLEQYIYLEHGAHYAIGALGLLMLASIRMEIPEVITGLIGVVFIALALWSSVRYNRSQQLAKG